MAARASHQRSVQFSENPVSAVRTISPPRTPKRMVNKSNVVSTPSRESASALPSGVESASRAKDLLLKELENYVVPFDFARLDSLLTNAASLNECHAFLYHPENVVYSQADGWNNIPETARTEKQLYKPLVKIVNAILHHFNLQDSRKAFDTHNANMHSDHIEGLKAKPDILITGSGHHFRGKISQRNRWYQCLSTIEVKKEPPKKKKKTKRRKTRRSASEDEDEDEDSEDEEGSEAEGSEDEEVIADMEEQEVVQAIEDEEKGERPEKYDKRSLAQLAFYARQTFSDQPTRMSVYNILITERRVRLFCFDRVGVQYSNWINYHDEAHKLVQMIALVSGHDLESLGLDKTVVFKDEKIQFTLQKDNKPFIVTGNIKPRFSSLGLRGRATVCWSVSDSDGIPYVVKQQFVVERRQKEHEMLKYLEREAKDTGIDISGLGKCVLGQTFGKVSEARGIQMPSTVIEGDGGFHDRSRYRMLLKEHGDTIDNLSGKTSLDLIVALRDAIEAHRTLWSANLVHRDISCNNILYREKEKDVNSNHRGVLIDLDLAIKLRRENSNCQADFRTGTRAFQSISVLGSYKTENDEGKELPVVLHDHLDDLESFFWVLFWITRERVGPGTACGTRPNLEVRWKFESDAETAISFKEGFLQKWASLVLQPGWGTPEQKLVENLAHYFYELTDDKFNMVHRKRIALTADQLVEEAPQHYSDVLGFFDSTIRTLKGEDSTTSDVATQSGVPRILYHSYSLPNLLAPKSDPKIFWRIPLLSKRPRDSADAAEDHPVEVDERDPTQPPPVKRLRSAKSEPALPRLKTGAPPRRLQLNGKKKAAISDADVDGQAAGPSRGRSSATRPKKASSSRGGRKRSAKRSTSKAGKKT